MYEKKIMLYRLLPPPNTPWFMEGLALHPMPTGPGHIILNLGPDT